MRTTHKVRERMMDRERKKKRDGKAFKLNRKIYYFELITKMQENYTNN